MRELTLYLLLVLMGVAWAQDETPPQEEEETATKDVVPERDQPDKCICPEPEVQQESQQLFPPNSVFLISPLPETPVQVAPEKKTIPGYIEHLESGYSDKDYRQIPPSD